MENSNKIIKTTELNNRIETIFLRPPQRALRCRRPGIAEGMCRRRLSRQISGSPGEGDRAKKGPDGCEREKKALGRKC